MKGSILFNPDINIEVDVDPAAEEGARLISAKNLVDGQEAGGGVTLAEIELITPYSSGGFYGYITDNVSDPTYEAYTEFLRESEAGASFTHYADITGSCFLIIRQSIAGAEIEGDYEEVTFESQQCLNVLGDIKITFVEE